MSATPHYSLTLETSTNLVHWTAIATMMPGTEESASFVHDAGAGHRGSQVLPGIFKSLTGAGLGFRPVAPSRPGSSHRIEMSLPHWALPGRERS